MNYLKLESIGNKVKKFWLVPLSLFLFISAIMGRLAIIGLVAWQRSNSHALDNMAMNFNFYWNIIAIHSLMIFAFVCLSIFYIFKPIFLKSKKDKEVKT